MQVIFFLIWFFIEPVFWILFMITNRYRWAESHGERNANENIHVVDKISQTAEEKGQTRLQTAKKLRCFDGDPPSSFAEKT